MELLESLDRLCRRGGLGDLDLEPVRGQAALEEHGLDPVHQVGPSQLAARYVDGHEEIGMAGLAPGCRLGARGPQHPGVDGADRPDLLGERDEAVGRYQAAGRMLPAHQRLGADDGSALHGDERLVEDAQLAALHRVAQVLVQVQPIRHRREHEWGEELDTSPARVLGRLHRQLGVSEHLGGPGSRVGRHRHADAEPDRQRAAPELEGDGESVVEPLRHVRGTVHVAHVLEEHRELVGAQPGDGVAGTEGEREPRCDRLEHGVADRVADAVVDRREVVHIDEEGGGDGAPPM